MFYLFRVWLPLSFVSLKIVFIKSIVSILVETNCFAINQLISYCNSVSLTNFCRKLRPNPHFVDNFGANNSNDCFIQS